MDHEKLMLQKKIVGARIRQYRKERNITQMELYHACGISTGNLSGIEQGKIFPSLPTISALAKYFQCSTDEIIFGKESGHRK